MAGVHGFKSHLYRSRSGRVVAAFDRGKLLEALLLHTLVFKRGRAQNLGQQSQTRTVVATLNVQSHTEEIRLQRDVELGAQELNLAIQIFAAALRCAFAQRTGHQLGDTGVAAVFFATPALEIDIGGNHW